MQSQTLNGDYTRAWGESLEQATKEVFQTMLASQLRTIQMPVPPSTDVTAVIGMTGQVCGTFKLQCSRKAAAAITATMLGAEVEATEQEVWDGVGEVCNMVAGSFKSRLSGSGCSCAISVPTVVAGADYSVRSLVDGQILERSFEFGAEVIWVSVVIKCSGPDK